MRMKFSLPKTGPRQQILRGIGPLRGTWEYRLATAGTVLLSLSGIIMIFIFWQRLPPAVPLWYSMPWGADRLASPWFLFLPVGISILIYLLNALMVIRIGINHPMFARVLFLTSLLVSALSFILVVRVLMLVS